MVFLAITQSGLDEILEFTRNSSTPIWCGSNAISEEKYANLEGSNISRFNYSLDGADEVALADALGTIAEHHPDEKIWIENGKPL